MFDFSKLRQAPVPQEYTFYQDFQIADMVGGEKGVRETYNSVKKNWSDNAKAWGEVSCALNWRLWDLAKSNEEIARLYEKLWMESQEIGWEKGNKDKEYASTYFRVTD